MGLVSRETMRKPPVDILSEQLESWGVGSNAPLLERLNGYTNLLSCYREARIVGTRDSDAILLELVLDSLSCLLFGPLWKARNLADVGSGAGLPGIPISLVREELRVTLIEATRKKTEFLRLAARDLALDGIEVVNGRAEEVGRMRDRREHYDVVTVRAVASLQVLAEYCLPLVREGGYVVAMKGIVAEPELKAGSIAAEHLGARVKEVLKVPLLDELRARHRTLVVLEKVRPTPDAYPRKPGMARKRPLGEG